MLGSAQAKLSFIVTPTRKLTAEYLTSNTRRGFYFHNYSRSGYWSKEHEDWSHVPLDTTYAYYNAPDHTPSARDEFSTAKLVWRDNVSPTMFYTVKLARFRRTRSTGSTRTRTTTGGGRTSEAPRRWTRTRTTTCSPSPGTTGPGATTCAGRATDRARLRSRPT